MRVNLKTADFVVIFAPYAARRVAAQASAPGHSLAGEATSPAA